MAGSARVGLAENCSPSEREFKVLDQIPWIRSGWRLQAEGERKRGAEPSWSLVSSVINGFTFGERHRQDACGTLPAPAVAGRARPPAGLALRCRSAMSTPLPWFIWALLSADFAALTAIFAKLGLAVLAIKW